MFRPRCRGRKREVREFEDGGRQLRGRQPIVTIGHRQDFQWKVIPMRAFDDEVVARISERRSVRDPQVAFITGDVDLHA